MMLTSIASSCNSTAFYCLCWEWFHLCSVRCWKGCWSNCAPVFCKLGSDFVFRQASWKPATCCSALRLFSLGSCCSRTSPFPCSPGVLAFKLHTRERSMGGNRVHLEVEGLAWLNNNLCIVQFPLKLMGRRRLKIWELILLSFSFRLFLCPLR